MFPPGLPRVKAFMPARRARFTACGSADGAARIARRREEGGAAEVEWPGCDDAGALAGAWLDAPGTEPMP
jgi:hypothetical protein